jgi:hypothetical protein
MEAYRLAVNRLLVMIPVTVTCARALAYDPEMSRQQGGSGLRIELPPVESLEIAWGEAVNGIALGLYISNRTFGVEEPLIVGVYLRNESSGMRDLSEAEPLKWVLSFLATDEHRQLLPNRLSEGRNFGSFYGGSFPSGASKRYKVNLRDYLLTSNAHQIVVTAKWKGEDGELISGNVIASLAHNSSARVQESDLPQTRLAAFSEKLDHIDYNGGLLFLTNRSSKFNAPENSPRGVCVAVPEGENKPTSFARIPETGKFGWVQKVGVGICGGLVFLLVAICCRASMRETADLSHSKD